MTHLAPAPVVRPVVSVPQAEELERQGKPWRIRLTYYGANPNNKSGQSHKAWEACRRSVPGDDAFVLFGFGPARKRITNWTGIEPHEAFKRAYAKLKKGYTSQTDPLGAVSAKIQPIQPTVESTPEPEPVPVPAGRFADSDAAFAARWRKQA